MSGLANRFTFTQLEGRLTRIGRPSACLYSLDAGRDAGTMRKIQLDELAVIEMYEQVENTREVAEVFGVCGETIRRVLKRHNVPRTHRHDVPKRSSERISHCHSKYCPALIVMLATSFGWSVKEISEATGYNENGTRNVLTKRGLRQPKKAVRSNYNLDAIECEYTVLGIPGRQLDEKYGLSEGSVCKWMRERGIRAGKGAHQSGPSKPELQERHKRAEIEFATRLHDEFGGRFEYVGGFRENGRKFATVRCVECGTEFEHYARFYGTEWTCPTCQQAELESRREARRQEVDAQRIARENEREFRKAYAIFNAALSELREYLFNVKTCAICGREFHPDNRLHRVCCSNECTRKYQSQTKRDLHRHRARRYHVTYDSTISLQGVYERDGGTCQICGCACDWGDKRYGDCGPTYPSIDHIVPFARGGAHTWDNVQLACFDCNSRKGTRSNDEAIAYVS